MAPWSDSPSSERVGALLPHHLARVHRAWPTTMLTRAHSAAFGARAMASARFAPAAHKIVSSRSVSTQLADEVPEAVSPAINAVVRNDWTREEIAAIYRMPFTELLHRAGTVHRQNFNPLEVQKCTLLSIKTGGCNEDCKYCAQSTRYKTFVKPQPMMSVDDVLEAAKRAKESGSTRFCMGTAWRELGNKKGAFGKILTMVSEVNSMGLEVCCTLGMVSKEQVAQCIYAVYTHIPAFCPTPTCAACFWQKLSNAWSRLFASTRTRPDPRLTNAHTQ
eukprot:266522-Pleurochrysis_carterae.AAC.3